MLFSINNDFIQAINFKLLGGMNPSAENYLVMHRFGDFSHANDEAAVKVVVEEFHQSLNSKMSSINIRGYIDSFAHRSELGSSKMSSLSVPILIITGTGNFLMPMIIISNSKISIGEHKEL